MYRNRYGTCDCNNPFLIWRRREPPNFLLFRDKKPPTIWQTEEKTSLSTSNGGQVSSPGWGISLTSGSEDADHASTVLHVPREVVLRLRVLVRTRHKRHKLFCKRLYAFVGIIGFAGRISSIPHGPWVFKNQRTILALFYSRERTGT